MAEMSKLFGITQEEILSMGEAGVKTVEEFYEQAKYPDSRTQLSAKTGIESFRLEELSSIAGNYLMMLDCAWDDDDE